MIRAWLDFFSPKRRKARQVKRMFGDYVSPDRVLRLIEEGECKEKTGKTLSNSAGKSLILVSFGHADWGFSEGHFARLQELLSEIRCGSLQMFHNRVVLSFQDEADAAQAAVSKLRELQSEADFSSFGVGIVEAKSLVNRWEVYQSVVASEKSDQFQRSASHP